MAVIGIKYDGAGKDLQYKLVYLKRRTGQVLLFDSGYFPKDWYDAKKKYISYADDELSLMGSSSCDQFITDGAEFDSAWLLWDKDVSNPRLVYEYTEDGWEMFVDKGTTPTWDELKEKCNNYNG